MTFLLELRPYVARFALPPMPLSVTKSTEGNQVCHCIAAESASRLQMMNLQIVEGTALLASPTISFQHLRV